MPQKRMTANPTKPARYRPGKALAPEPTTSSEEESGSEVEDTTQQQAPPPPKATSYPSTNATKLSTNLSKVDLNERRQQAAALEAARVEAEKAERAEAEEGFVTEEESEADSADDEEEGEEGSSEEEESTSSDEAPRKLLRPVFVRKNQRQPTPASAQKPQEQLHLEDLARRKAKADALLQEQISQRAALKAAGQKAWDDDEEGIADDVDDTDGLDPDAERAAWKLRELQRIARTRAAIEDAERERAEIERRRNMSTPEREAEDRERTAAQKAEKGSRGKMEYLQKYHHRGAFFMDDETAAELAKRDIAGAKFQDQTDRALLPKALQMRDMTKIGKKGATKYRDLMSEDTGRFGVDRGRGGYYQGDERLRPDDERFRQDRGGVGATGANSTVVGDRKRPAGAPDAPKAMRDGDREAKRPRYDER